MPIHVRDVLADIQFQIYTDQEMISEGGNPILLYEENLEGNLLDIGCGQSSYILSMLDTPLNFFALDPDQKQIEYLMQRVNRLSPGRKITTFIEPFNSKIFPEAKFDYIIMSNLLHLKEAIPDLQVFIDDVKRVMADNCMILVCTHEGKDAGDEYFRPLTEESLKALFPKNEFAHLYWAFHQGQTNKYSKRFGENYMNMVLDDEGIEDPEERAWEKAAYHIRNSVSELVLLVRKIK